MSAKNYSMIAAGLAFINGIREDIFMDPPHESYQGFLNIGKGGYIPNDDIITWEFICNNPKIFKPIIAKLGLGLEGDVLNYFETVFVPQT